MDISNVQERRQDDVCFAHKLASWGRLVCRRNILHNDAKVLSHVQENVKCYLFQNFVCSQNNEPVAALCLFVGDILNCSSCRSPRLLTALRNLANRIFWKNLPITEAESGSLGRILSGGGRFRLSESRCGTNGFRPVSQPTCCCFVPHDWTPLYNELSYLRCFEEEVCRSLRTATKIVRRKWKTGRIYPSLFLVSFRRSGWSQSSPSSCQTEEFYRQPRLQH